MPPVVIWRRVKPLLTTLCAELNLIPNVDENIDLDALIMNILLFK